jgi:hypothetical protein
VKGVDMLIKNKSLLNKIDGSEKYFLHHGNKPFLLTTEKVDELGYF